MAHKQFIELIRSEQANEIAKNIEGSTVVIEGANGAIGLSLGYILGELDTKPSSLVLTSRHSAPDLAFWNDICSDLHHFTADEIEQKLNLLKVCENPIVVFFCAGYGQPNKFMNDGAGIISDNVNGLLQYAGLDKVSHFAFMSTSEIYSGMTGIVAEDSPTKSQPQNPRSIYIETKRLSEAICLQHLSREGLRLAIYRVALAFPPKPIRGDSRVLADLIKSGQETGVVTLHGGGHQLRQYQFGPVAAIKILSSLFNGKSELYNCAGSDIVTLEQLATQIATVLDVPVDVKQSQYDTSAPETVRISASLLDDESGFLSERQGPLDKYLRILIDS